MSSRKHITAIILGLVLLSPIVINSANREFGERKDFGNITSELKTNSLALDTVLEDDFNSNGYNSSIWEYEAYGNGSVTWVESEYVKLAAETHSFRTLSSKMLFSSGHIADFRLRMDEDQAVVCIGWTNSTNATSWNYRFTGDNVHVQYALDNLISESHLEGMGYRKLVPNIDTSEWHDYRLIWNRNFSALYVDGEQVAVTAKPMTEGAMRFKITITEFRDVPCDGWVLIDYVRVSSFNLQDDLDLPIIALNSPGNGSTNYGNTLIDISAIGSDGNITYSWDYGEEVEVQLSDEIRLPNTEGVHVLRVTAVDGFGLSRETTKTFVFKTIVSPPRIDVMYSTTVPTIDGTIQGNEYPQQSSLVLSLENVAGSVLLLQVYMFHDSEFLYVAINSTKPSGHDSRAAILLSNSGDNHYHGMNQTPISSALYVKGSPDAWEGYDELVYVYETAEGTATWSKVLPIPPGFLAASAISMTGVHYEFRVPISDFSVTPGGEISFCVMLHPSGLGLDSTYYPIFEAWKNASHLSILRLSPTSIQLLGPIMLLGIAGIVGVGTLVFVRRQKGGQRISEPLTPTESRVRDIVQSYTEIAISKLSSMTSLDLNQTEQIVQSMIDQGKLNAEFDKSSGIIRRRG